MKVAVLGAGGFIGSNLVAELLSHTDWRLVLVDISLDKLDQTQLGYQERVETHKTPISGSLGVLAGCDVVVDLVAYANPSLYVSQPLDVVKLNFFDNLQVVEFCARSGIKLVQFSSCEVYGVTGGRTEPFNEDHSSLIMGPISQHRWIYANAKQLLERMVHAYGLEKGLKYTIVRPFNFIGPKIDYIPEPGMMGGPRVFSHFFSALKHNTPLRLVDGGHARRSYTHISDAVCAIRLILERAPDNEIYNIGNPENEISIRDMAILMKTLWAELTGREASSELVDIAGHEFYGLGYADCDRRIPDVAKISSFGWKPRYDLRNTLMSTMQYYLDNEVF